MFYKYTIFINENNDVIQANHVFLSKEIDQSCVFKQLSTLKANKAIGLDNISARLLKSASSVIAPLLTKLFNMSLSMSKFPTLWKCAKVVALFKSGDKYNVTNYHPISILPTMSKILERAVFEQFYSYLSSNNLLSTKQFGFKPRLSTTVALAEFCDNILTGMENGKVTGAAFLDMAKAFDTVDHPILHSKLSKLGVRNSEINWFKSYLSQRSQVTKFGNCVSKPLPVTVGVPQGSILGPLLFIVYVNDLPNSLKYCDITLYADDSAIHCTETTPEEMKFKMNTDLYNLANWFSKNKLTLNISKSKFMIFGHSARTSPFSTLSLTVCGKELHRVESFKYLEVTLNQRLSWEDHIANIATKVKKRIEF